jgi:hypothetical protein
MNTPLMQQQADTNQSIFGHTIQKADDKTGLPSQLKGGMEALSGYSLDNVKVHYNSSKPASVQAHAYAQGTDIHLAPGQEKHLPHELGHVVQQMQGRVQPTTSVGGVAVNDSPQLEQEATQMGDKAMQMQSFGNSGSLKSANAASSLQRTAINSQELKGYIGKVSLLNRLPFNGGQKSALFSAVDAHNSAIATLQSLRTPDELTPSITTLTDKQTEAMRIANDAKTRNEDKKGKKHVHKEGFYDTLILDLQDDVDKIDEIKRDYNDLVSQTTFVDNSQKKQFFQDHFVKKIETSKLRAKKGVTVQSYDDQIALMKALTDLSHIEGDEKLSEVIKAASSGPIAGEGEGSTTAQDAFDFFTSTPGEFFGGDGISGAADALTGKTASTSTEGGTFRGEKLGLKEEHGEAFGIAADSLAIVAVVPSLFRLKSIIKNSDGKKGLERAAEIADGLAAGTKTSEGLSKVINHAGHDTGTSGSVLEGISEGLSAFKYAFLVMKSLNASYTSIKDGDTKEGLEEASRALEGLLGTAKSVMLSIKSFIEMVEGSASGQLMSSIPVLSIVFSGVKLLQNFYHLMISHNNANKIKEKFISISGVDLDTESENYRVVHAQDANATTYGNLDERITDKQTIITQKEDEKTTIENKAVKTNEDNAKLVILAGQLRELNSQKQQLEDLKSHKKLNEFNDGKDASYVEQFKEYNLQKELVDANQKRRNRQALKMGIEMAKIAGSIVSLTGVGAVVGGAIRGGAALVEGAMPLVRGAKQASRDKAAKAEALGEKSFFKDTLHANTSKSTVAKRKWRVEQASTLYDKIKNLADPREGSIAETEKKKRVKAYEMTHLYLSASGVNLTKLYRASEIDTIYDLLIEAISGRDF